MGGKRREFRNEATGVTWVLSALGDKVTIEITRDDDPEPLVRTRVMSLAEIDAIVAEQLADGFVEHERPVWAPSAAWIASASDTELCELSDAWIIAVARDPSLVDRIPGPVADYVSVHAVIVQTLRNGLPSFFCEDDPRLVQRFVAAARAMGRPELADPFERATANMDLTQRRTLGDPLSWTDRKAMHELERCVSKTSELSLLPWMRAHASEFATPIARPA